MQSITAVIDATTPNLVKVTINEDGIELNKTIEYDEFAKIFIKRVDTQRIHVGKLPKNTIDLIVSPRTESLNGKIAVFVPASMIFMPFLISNKKMDLMLPFPSLIFIYEIAQGKLVESKVYACKEKTLGAVNKDTELFNYPYGNVSPSSGQICWGGNVIHTLDRFAEIDTLTTVFFSAPMNMDLYQKSISNSSGLDLPTFLDAVKEKKNFPAKYLVPTKLTFGTYFNN